MNVRAKVGDVTSIAYSLIKLEPPYSMKLKLSRSTIPSAMAVIEAEDMFW